MVKETGTVALAATVTVWLVSTREFSQRMALKSPDESVRFVTRTRMTTLWPSWACAGVMLRFSTRNCTEGAPALPETAHREYPGGATV